MLIQNFSVSAGDELVVTIDVDPDEGLTLVGATVYWRAYPQAYGVPVAGADPVIEKVSDHGIAVANPTSIQVEVTLDEDDTIALLGNYYHELTIVDAGDRRSTPTVGIMTVTQTENRF